MKTWVAVLAVVGGFVLSFVGLGVLWVGTPVPAQLLLGLAFALLSWVVARASPATAWPLVPLLLGALPIGAMLVQFRDAQDSHLGMVLVVASWGVGALAGQLLARRGRPRQSADRARP